MGSRCASRSSNRSCRDLGIRTRAKQRLRLHFCRLTGPKKRIVKVRRVMTRMGALLVCGLISFNIAAQQPESKAAVQPYSFSLTVKLHSTGHSMYGGQYLNHHFNSEISVSCRYRTLGGFVTKNTDIVDLHSSINYTTMGIFKSFHLGNSLTVMPYVGGFFRQSHSFADNASDGWACVVLRYQLTNFLTIENTSLVSNLIRHHTKASLVNRLNATIFIGKIKIDAYGWYCRSINSQSHFVSTSVAVTSPDWLISPSLSARLQVAILQYITAEKPEAALRRGGLISLIVPFSLSKRQIEKESPTDSNDR